MQTANFEIVVIGGGESVKRRILPALHWAGYGPDQIVVLSHKLAPDFDIAELERYATVRLFEGNPEQNNGVIPSLVEFAESLISHDTRVVIGTPSFAHLGYARAMLRFGARVAVEKPLICTEGEMEALAELAASRYASRLFCMSQYRLERGLPLLGLMHPEIALPKNILKSIYAAGQEVTMPGRRKISALRDELGKLTQAEILLLEKPDPSLPSDAPQTFWFEDRRFGGTLFEVFVHNMILADAVAGDPNKWDNCEWQFGIHTARQRLNVLPSYIDLQAKAGGADLRLVCGKRIRSEFACKIAKFAFESGNAILDLNSSSLAVTVNGHTASIPRIKLGADFAESYRAQMKMFLDMPEQGWSGRRFDGLPEYIKILDFLFNAPQRDASLTKAYDDNVRPENLPGLELVAAVRAPQCLPI